MPLWTALGTKSSTSVAPFGAPGSAPLSPQPATPTSARAVASSATVPLMRRRKLFHPPIVSTLPPLTCSREPRRKRVQERGLAAYLAELIGTLLLVFFITSVVVLYVSTGGQAQFGSDFAVVGLVHAFLLFGLIVMFGVVSGGHFNPAVTLGAMAIRRIRPLDGVIYMLAQLSGAVLGALLTKGLLLDEGRATHYGAAHVSALLGSSFRGSIVEAIGTFVLVLVILTAVYSEKSFKEWAPLAIGTTLGFIVMVGGPLTGGSFNPARWFGPALVSGHWTDAWLYVVGPLVGGVLGAVTYWYLFVDTRFGRIAAPGAGPTGLPQDAP